ncbi:unannotated protein [freshwater metagenome]|uniref:Unannotated protein n=1 Tax=freshwater metagenome TaxID=449393 RepID=A0A6J7E120_9ZZZZ|nr:ABC transporter permease subunit [Actinomycetota bacterium]
MRTRSVVAPALGIVTFFGLWELLVRVGNVPSYSLRPPSQVLRYLFNDSTGFPKATWQTGADALEALLLALLIGLAFGSLMAASRWLEEAAQPVLILIQVTPWVAYSASVVLWIGGGSKPVLFVATLVCVPAFAFASMSGLRSADPAALELLRCVDASAWETLWHVRLPNALPNLFTAARFAVGLSLAAVYFTEGGALSNRGLGAIGAKALAATAALPLWSTVFCSALLGTIALVSISVLERVLLGWHASQRRAAR